MLNFKIVIHWDLWDIGIQDDKFSVLAQMNEKVNISIKSEVGDSERTTRYM